MKRLIPMLVLAAFSLALAAPMALAAGSKAAPAKTPAPAKATAAPEATPAKTAPAAPAKTAPAAPAKTTPTTARATHEATAKLEPAKKTAMIDINSAPKEELMKLPAMTDAVADKIIAGRPYKSRLDLLKKKIVPAADYQKMRLMLTAKQAPAGKK
jgi:competence protein ComEA